MKKIFLLFLLFSVGCTTVYIGEVESNKIKIEEKIEFVNKVSEEKNLEKIKKTSFIDLVGVPQLTDCKETKDFIEKIPEVSFSHKKIVKILGLPQYEATNYKKEQTSIYKKLKGDKFCYLVVITFDKERNEMKTTIFSKIAEKNKIEH